MSPRHAVCYPRYIMETTHITCMLSIRFCAMSSSQATSKPEPLYTVPPALPKYDIIQPQNRAFSVFAAETTVYRACRVHCRCIPDGRSVSCPGDDPELVVLLAGTLWRRCGGRTRRVAVGGGGGGVGGSFRLGGTFSLAGLIEILHQVGHFLVVVGGVAGRAD